MQGINGTAEIIQTTNSDVDLDKIIGRNAFSLQKILDMEPDFLKVPSTGTFHSLPIACSLPDNDCKLLTMCYGKILFKELVILWRQVFANTVHCHACHCVCEWLSGYLHAMLWLYWSGAEISVVALKTIISKGNTAIIRPT